MKAPIRTLMSLALATALAAPVALAQTDTRQEVADPQATDALPPQVNPAEVAEQGVDPRLPVADDAEDPMSAVPPPPPRTDAQASGHAHVAERSRWTELDVDGDGRVSAEEGRADAELRTGFEAMDADRDGFVSEAEFGAGASVDDGATDADAMDQGGGREIDADDHHDGMHDRDRMDDDGTGDEGMESKEADPAMDGDSEDAAADEG